MRRTVAILLPLATALLVNAPSASAGIWTPIASGTTQSITAIDSRAPGDNLYATSGGRILRNGTQQFEAAGFSITDIKLNPSGTRALASASNGKLYRFNGTAWSLVSLANTTFNHTCTTTSGAPFARNAAPTGNLTALTWVSDTVAYVAGADRGVVIRYTDGPSPSVTDVSRQSTGLCKADSGFNEAFSDIQSVNAQLIYLTTTSFGRRVITADGFASGATSQEGSAVNCPSAASHIAIDLDNPNRSFVVGGPQNCNGTLSFGFSSNNGTDYALGTNYPNGDGGALTGFSDVAVSGGSAVAVGNGGAILVSRDGVDAFFQPADGEATTNWLSVDKTSATAAVIGGPGGKLYVSTQANAIPDLVPPAGTVTGPATVTVGQPATFTANVADNAGGSGVSPGSFAWSATGLPAATGNPVSLTFPSAGFYTVEVTFKDAAGNTGTASYDVRANAPLVTPPGGGTTPPKPLSTTLTKSVKVAGGTVSLGVPRACIPVGSTFKATLKFKRATRKGSLFVRVSRVAFTVDGKRRTIDSRAPFVRTISVRALKAGSRHTLKAQATIKVKRGRSPKKSISTSFTVCG